MWEILENRWIQPFSFALPFRKYERAVEAMKALLLTECLVSDIFDYIKCSILRW